jgi:hypothetical protein
VLSRKACTISDWATLSGALYNAWRSVV